MLAPVPDRSEDWFSQAKRNLEQALASRAEGRDEWACFAAHQAAEMAIKALHLARGQEAWGHVLTRLLADLPHPVAPALRERARVLDNYYVPTRYPSGHVEGAPYEHYGPLQSKEAIAHARATIDYVGTALA